MTASLTAIAPAKLNLYLHITGKREDGYHLLDSLVAFTDFGDRVTIEPAATLSLSVSGPFAEFVPTDESNLVLRAARLLQNYAGTQQGAAVHLEKNIPVGAGLGGGSSDAAAAVRLLCDLWSIALPASRAAEMLAPLGADIPICYNQKPAFMSGIGERIDTLDAPLPGCHLLLVKPGPSLPTKDVYNLYSPETRDNRRPPWQGGSFDELITMLQPTRNDLQRPAIALCAEIAQVLIELQTQIGCSLARLCGSGSACFGVFEDETQARRAAAEISRAHPQWWVQ